MASLNQKNIWEFEKSFHLFPLGRAKLSGVFEKLFVLQKTPSLIWTKGVEMHTHFWGFLRKIFIRWKYPLTYLELQSQITPYFAEKWENIFRLRVLYFACSEKSLHLFPLGTAKCTPKISKIFCPFTYLELGCQNATCFLKKQKNFFEKTAYLKNFPLLVPTGRGHLGTVIPKKGKKICPPKAVDRDKTVKMPVKQRNCSDWSGFFFRG